MLNPSLADLLDGVADALADGVLAELPPGPARQQCQAAIAITRRVARALPQLVAHLQEDTRDLAATLRQLGAGPSAPRRGEGDEDDEILGTAFRVADALAGAPLVGLDELTSANLALRAAVAELAEAAGAGALSSEADDVLRALLVRVTAREAALGLSPWGRPPGRA